MNYLTFKNLDVKKFIREHGRPPIIAVDFDGTCFITNFPDPGGIPRLSVIKTLRQKQKDGAYLILWTCRCGIYLQEAIELMRQFSVEFEKYNQPSDYELQNFDKQSPKIFADVYLDDLCVNVNSEF